MSPIKSIDITNKINNRTKDVFNWKDDYLEIKRINNISYIPF